jgi:hypothetical protein
MVVITVMLAPKHAKTVYGIVITVITVITVGSRNGHNYSRELTVPPDPEPSKQIQIWDQLWTPHDQESMYPKPLWNRKLTVILFLFLECAITNKGNAIWTDCYFSNYYHTMLFLLLLKHPNIIMLVINHIWKLQEILVVDIYLDLVDNIAIHFE